MGRNEALTLAERPAGWFKILSEQARCYFYSILAAEVTTVARYYRTCRFLASHQTEREGNEFYGRIQAPQKCWSCIEDEIGNQAALADAVVVLDGDLQESVDVQELLQRLRQDLADGSRLLVVAYNCSFTWLYRLTLKAWWRRPSVPRVFLTVRQLEDLARLTQFDIVRHRRCGYFPWRWFGAGDLINRWLPLLPVLKRLSLASVFVLRPSPGPRRSPNLSVVIPARNERGNIQAAVDRLPRFADHPGKVEVLFVEGHSHDDTWDEIRRVTRENSRADLVIRSQQQTGVGKANAVREAIAAATGELITILDADLTMPPEYLPRFYAAYRQGLADFINGNRLMYPMEPSAMRPANWLGNVFFAKALSRILQVPIADSLCGTKLFRRKDYEKFSRWREDFGEVDPFGDFELLFPAAQIGLQLINLPIPYKERQYGATNIRRFADGWRLFRMVLRGFRRISLGQIPARAQTE